MKISSRLLCEEQSRGNENPPSPVGRGVGGEGRGMTA